MANIILAVALLSCLSVMHCGKVTPLSPANAQSDAHPQADHAHPATGHAPAGDHASSAGHAPAHGGAHAPSNAHNAAHAAPHAAQAAQINTHAAHKKENSFSSSKIVPDVLPVAPEHILKVKYGSVEVAEGNELKPKQVKEQPSVEWQADPQAYYTLCMTDPDAPSRKEPTRREYLHWLVGNIKGSSLDKGEILAAYTGSAPPKDTELHRYVFVLYKQPKEIKFDETHIAKGVSNGRPKFSISKFADKYKLGAPVAGNFFQAQFDKEA